jgi:hypothetical protein
MSLPLDGTSVRAKNRIPFPHNARGLLAGIGTRSSSLNLRLLQTSGSTSSGSLAFRTYEEFDSPRHPSARAGGIKMPLIIDWPENPLQKPRPF